LRKSKRHTYSNSYGYSSGYGYSYTDGNAYCYSDCYGYVHADTYSDANRSETLADGEAATNITAAETIG
jgi:hypothetical protein